MNAARDVDVVIVRAALPERQRSNRHVQQVHFALDRIEQRLAAGAAAGAVVDECVKAGHIKAVAP